MKEFSQNEGEFNESVSRFEQMLKRKERYYFDRDDLEDIVEFYINVNHHQKALKAIHFAEGQFPDTTFFTLRKSQLLSANGQYDEALRLLNDLEIFEPGNPEIFVTRGSIYAMQSRPAEAIESIND